MFQLIFTILLVSLRLSIGDFRDTPVGEYLYYDDLGGNPYTVTSDQRSFIVNGKRTMFLGGTIHYPRMSYYTWKDMLIQMKNDGLNHVQCYVFWNLHEPVYNFNGTHIYNYEGRANITHYLEIAKQVGMFVDLRIGPFVAAEWRFGSLPPYLLHVNGLLFRDYNDPWMHYMQIFVNEIASQVRPYLSEYGGPIFMAQIENEYHGSGANGTAYVNWCGELAMSLNFSIPWIMCNGESSNLTINTCNGNDCYTKYLPSHLKQYPNQPLAWTENEGWFQAWAGDNYNANQTGRSNRSPQDMANVIAKWFGGGASHHNYYMYFGGNHLSNYAGSGITNYYADGVNYHADGLPNEPKRSHLVRLHEIIAQKQYILLSDDIQYGNAIHLNTTGDLLYSDACKNGGASQIWQYNASSKMLFNDFENEHCVVANGHSNPVATALCDMNDNSQKWDYNGNGNTLQFVSVSQKTCLDIDHATQSIDEYKCKTSTPNNQQFVIDSDTNTIHAHQNDSNCLTMRSENNKINYNLFAYVYKQNGDEYSDNIAFLYNNDTSNDHTVIWRMNTYLLPSKSVSIVDDQGMELYNSAKVNEDGLPTKRIYETLISGKNMNFSSWNEVIPINAEIAKLRKDEATLNVKAFEHIRFTNDTNQHLIYSTNISNLPPPYKSGDDVRLFWEGGQGNTFVVFIDSNYVGQVWNGLHAITSVNYSVVIDGKYVSDGQHTLTMVSSSLGIATHVDQEVSEADMDHKGIVGSVQLRDAMNNNNAIIMDLTKNGWEHWIGLSGELLQIYKSEMSGNVNWKYPADTNAALNWYKTEVEIDGNAVYNDGGVMLIDIGDGNDGLNRGHFYLNGMDMGYYFNVIQNGVMMQRYYFIPKDFINVNATNLLVFADELPNVTLSNMNIVKSTVVIP